MSGWHVPRPGHGSDIDWSFESFALHDYDYERRIAATKALRGKDGHPDKLPRNLKEEQFHNGLLCYTNLWSVHFIHCPVLFFAYAVAFSSAGTSRVQVRGWWRPCWAICRLLPSQA